MASITIRNIPDEVHAAIRVRARRNGRSTEAEVRMILQAAAERGQGGIRVGDELAALGKAFGGIELPDREPTIPMRVASFK